MSRRVGAPPGNQNARKHGYYSDALTLEDRRNLLNAANVADLDQEINLLRAKLKSVAKYDPNNVKLIAVATSGLARLLRAHKKLIEGTGRDQRLGAAIQNIIRDIGGPMGVVSLEEKAEFDEWIKLKKNNLAIPKPNT